MKTILSDKVKLVTKIVCAVIVLCVMIGLYPLCIIPSAGIDYIPDGTFEWKETETIILNEGDELRQEYHPQRMMKLQTIGLVFERISGDTKGKLLLSVYDSSENMVGHSEVELTELICRKKQIIPLKTSRIDEGNTYYITVKADGNASVEMFLVDRKAENYFGATYINGEVCEKSLLAQLHTAEYTARDVGIYVWLMGILLIAVLVVPWKKIGYFYLRIFTILDVSVFFLVMSYYQKMDRWVQYFPELKKLYLIFIAISMMVLLAHAYISAKNLNRKVEKCFLVSVLGWGIVYLLLMPPYSYPDEPTHFAQANAYVNQIMGQEVHDQNGQIYIRNEDLIDVVSFPDSASLVNYYDGCFVREVKPGYGIMDMVNGKGLGRASTVCYIPFEVGILISRTLGLNYIWSFTLSNLLGLLCYMVMVYVAMRMIPIGKWILFLSAQFPLALSMATSFTYDMINYALLTLFFALFCKILYDEKKVAWKQIIAFAVMGILVFPIKYAYIPFCAFVLLLPNKKFGNQNANIIKATLIVICLVVAFKDNAILSGLGIGGGTQVKSNVETDAFDVEKLYQVRESSWKSRDEIIGDKGNLIKYTYNTFYAHLDYYWNGMIGMKIGWGDSFIPDFIYNIWWFLIVFAILGTRGERYVFDLKVRIGTFLICALSFGAIYIAMLLGATPVGYTDCPSVGARYLLPLLLPTCIALRGNKINISQGVSDELFIWGVDLCQIIAMVYMFVGYLNR
jgi:uncharacterized membrane protein